MTTINLSRRSLLGLGAGTAVAAVAGFGIDNANAVLPKLTPALDRAFAAAAKRHDVPKDLLIALAVTETNMRGRGGQRSKQGKVGIAGLTDNASDSKVQEAAALTKVDAQQLRTDDAANIAGAAALLRARANEAGLDAATRRNINAWHPILVTYAKAHSDYAAMQFADAVFDTLADGDDQAPVRVAPRQVDPDRHTTMLRTQMGATMAVATADAASSAKWVPANANNYTVANRPNDRKITHVILHVMQGSYAGSISWFQDPAAQSSAHYMVRSKDGDVTQMVRDKDIAWHAGVWTMNEHSIGIECEGWIDDPKWFTDALYKSAAELTRTICKKYGIPMDRQHILGHVEVKGATHTDPGPNWDWKKFMSYVTQGAESPSNPTPKWSQEVDNASDRFSASANWGTSSWSSQRRGANYRFAKPQAISDPAWYRFAVPAKGTYKVEIWYPSGTGYSSAAPFLVQTTSGMKTVNVDQRSGGGAWKSLGNFTLAAGDRNVVGVSRWTSADGLILADAVRLTRIA